MRHFNCCIAVGSLECKIYICIRMNTLVKAHLMLISTALISGANYTISKVLMPDYMAPSAIIFLRAGSAAVFFSIVYFIFIKEKIDLKKDFFTLLKCALFGITVNQLLFFEGLNLTTPINAALMMTSTPLIVLLISSIMSREKITLKKIIGVISGAAGAILLLLHSGSATTSHLFTGDLLVLLNATSYAIFLVLVTPLLQKYNPFTIVMWLFNLGFLMIVPFGFLSITETNWTSFTREAWLALIYVIIFTTFFAYYMNVGVLKFVHPSLAGSYIYLQPLIAAVIAVLYGKDEITPEKVFFAALIFTGVYLVSKKKVSGEV